MTFKEIQWAIQYQNCQKLILSGELSECERTMYLGLKKDLEGLLRDLRKNPKDQSELTTEEVNSLVGM